MQPLILLLARAPLMTVVASKGPAREGFSGAVALARDCFHRWETRSAEAIVSGSVRGVDGTQCVPWLVWWQRTLELLGLSKIAGSVVDWTVRQVTT